MAAELKPRLAFDEYLEIESKAEFKSEFVNGEMYAQPQPKTMIGTSRPKSTARYLRSKSIC